MADFLTVDLGQIYRTQKSASQATVKQIDANNTKQASQPNAVPAKHITDWGTELKNRLSANNKLSAEAKVEDYEIESKFFEEYFNSSYTAWKPYATQLLRLGEPLKKAIKVLGFDTKTNPILAFIQQQWVLDNLIKTNLLNSNTFKAIYNAVSKNIVADSEFTQVNDSNIIYCKDLYNKSPKEMFEYLSLQASILTVSASSYPEALCEKNRKVFIEIPNIAEKNPRKRALLIKDPQIKGLPVYGNTKLNSLNQADLINRYWNKETQADMDAADKEDENTKPISSKEQQALADKLNTPAQILAAIQMLIMTTNNENAQKAISYSKFKEIPAIDLLKATSGVAKIMPKGQIKSDDADALVDLLLKKL